MFNKIVWLLVLGVSACANAQPVAIPNGSFETGSDNPDGWKLSGDAGAWESFGHSGKRCISVTGTGQNTNYWSTTEVKLEPGKTYRLSFWMMGIDASGGCVITGPSFCNRDFSAGDKWRRLGFVFLTPKDVMGSYLRFGQWMVKGKVCFDDITLTEVSPVHLNEGGFTLGDGETTDGSHYTAQPSLGGEGASYSHVLADFNCGFNSNRWCFGGDSFVTYRHQVSDRMQEAAKVTVNVGYYTGGKCVVEASANGRDYVSVGEITRMDSPTFIVPQSLFPAQEIFVRMRSASAPDRKGDSAPGAFQVHSYTYEADLDASVPVLTGDTRYLEIVKQSDALKVRVDSLGPLRPAPNSRSRLSLTNATGNAASVKAILTIGERTFTTAAKVAGGGKTSVEIPYEISGAGEMPLKIAVSSDGKEVYSAVSSINVPQLFASDYGYRIPNVSSSLGLWWCEATYKISRERPLPRATRNEVSISAARNEYEPFQLVFRPAKRLENVTIEVTDLRSVSKGRIPKENVQIDLVEYVKVAHPTDAAGISAWWPDPLPHYKGAFVAEADRNQPIWLTVYVPENAPAGDYTGTIILNASGETARVPVKLHVWNFTLPKETHVHSGFGFNPGNVQRYQNLATPAEVTQVMEKYYQNFAAHRICPYTPMRPIKVTFTGRKWIGGEVVTDEKHSGNQSLKIADENEKATIEAHYDGMIPVDASATYRLAWWCKTAKAGQQYMVTVGQHDANGDWRSGHNRDIVREGNGEWKREEAEIRFDEGTHSADIALRPTVWTEDGRFTGTAWFDDVSFSRADDAQNLLTDGNIEAKLSDVKVSFDFTEFDEDAHHFLDELGYNSFALPVMGLGGGTFYARTQGELAGIKAGTPEYHSLFARYLKPIQDHLAEKGWLKKAYVYWFDEPSPQDYDFVREGMKTLAQAAPGICKFLTVKPVKELYGNVDLWCIPVGVYSPEDAHARQAKGEGIWWYLCCGPHEPFVGLFIDHPAIDFRMWLWMSWKYNVQGILIWETIYWTSSAAYPKELQNPWEDPMSYVSGYGTPAGTKAFWGNGDGRLFYPANRDVLHDRKKYLEGPVNSIRVELMREGIEDFEYFYLLKQAVAQAKTRTAAVANAEKLLNIPASIITDLTHFTQDPQPLYAYRERVAKAIETLR